MVGIIKSVFVMLSIFAGLASAYCRQCAGKQIITFTTDVSEKQARDFFRTSIAECVTGNDYWTLGVSRNGRTWTTQVKVWRYCGVGKSNYVNKGAHCIGDVCASEDYRVLTCSKTANCADNEECSYSACHV